LPVTSTHNHFLINKNSNLKSSLFLSSSTVSISKSDKVFNNTNNQPLPPPKPPRQPLKTQQQQQQQNSTISSSALVEANEYKPKNATLSRTEYKNR
jgi:hypothetical protein